MADCERCQSLMGAMARANAVIPASEPERTGRPWLAWLVPLTAVAAALTLWVAVPRERYESPAPPPSLGEVQAEPRKQAPPNPALHAAEPAEESKPTSNVARRATAAAPAAAPAPGLRRDSERLETDALKEEKDERIAPASPAAAAPSAVGAIAGAPPQATRAAAAAEAEADKAQSANGVSQPAQTCSPGWSAAPANLAAQLTAGASPAASVCWLVSRSGVVIVTIDNGRTWRRVTFPEITDLSAVRATDARTASVSTADGRQFSTSDGGGTWVRR